MGFNSRVLLHLGGILLTMMLLCWCLLNTDYYATMLVLLLALGAQVLGLLRLLHATNRELVRFLDALRYTDFSQSFNIRHSSASFRQLAGAFNDAMERFRAQRGDREQQAVYLQSLVQHLPVAVLAVDENRRIVLSNTALLRLLKRGTAPASLQALAESSPELADAIAGLRPGKESTLLLRQDGENSNVKLSCTVLRQPGQQQKLVSIQNIESELELRELEAWQNLIRVMTHEIMNSVTPIASLAETAGHYLDESRSVIERGLDGNGRNALLPLLEDASSAVGTIGKRGQGLMRFVDSYRTLSRLPKPRPAQLPVLEAFRSVEALFGEQLRQAGVNLELHCHPETLQLYIDADQLEQALINLLRNALEAVGGRENPSIALSATLEEGGLIGLTLSDNGGGISRENLDNIFVPFFTTKRGGSGIGMSMVKQIVQANGGRISVSSSPGRGTTIRMSFRQY